MKHTTDSVNSDDSSRLPSDANTQTNSIRLARLQEKLRISTHMLTLFRKEVMARNGANGSRFSQTLDTLVSNSDYQIADNNALLSDIMCDSDMPNREAVFESALKRILSIENQKNGGDWDEIESARLIAQEALNP